MVRFGKEEEKSRRVGNFFCPAKNVYHLPMEEYYLTGTVDDKDDSFHRFALVLSEIFPCKSGFVMEKIIALYQIPHGHNVKTSCFRSITNLLCVITTSKSCEAGKRTTKQQKQKAIL